ncbi:MAG: hypothetical protein HQ596_06090 [Candidatus Saganbacteria bacterium]|nr:hypothetical protein [Candidatus Saganbacteria bacterium]
MGFRVQRRYVPAVVCQAQVTPANPLFFHRGSYRKKDGVFTLAQHRNSQAVYFYPRTTIEQEIEARGGRDEYAYHEGFNAHKILKGIGFVIRMELPRWRGRLGLPRMVSLNQIILNQPGLDIWRVLLFAWDHSEGLENFRSPECFINDDGTPPVFGVTSSSLGTVLIAGNCRALFGFSSGLEGVPMVTVPAPLGAHRYTNVLSSTASYIEGRYDSRGVLALARHFVNEAEELEHGSVAESRKGPRTNIFGDPLW